MGVVKWWCSSDSTLPLSAGILRKNLPLPIWSLWNKDRLHTRKVLISLIYRFFRTKRCWFPRILEKLAIRFLKNHSMSLGIYTNALTQDDNHPTVVQTVPSSVSGSSSRLAPSVFLSSHLSSQHGHTAFRYVRYSRLMLYISCPRPGIKSFPKENQFLWVGNAIWRPQFVHQHSSLLLAPSCYKAKNTYTFYS